MTTFGSAESALVIDDRGPVRLMTLNRPRVRNAVNNALAAELSRALSDLESRDDLQVGVITGTPPGFCAGMDLKAFAAGERGQVDDYGFAGITRRSRTKPLIAAIEGFALAGGLEIVLACDVIVAATDALLGLPEVSRGIVASAGGLIRLPAQISRHVAADMVLTAEPISGTRAHEVGLATRLAQPGDALRDALVIADRIAQNNREAISASMRIMPLSTAAPTPETWEQQDAIARPVLESTSASEGARAFTKGRAS